MNQASCTVVPLRFAGADVEIFTNDADFAAVARRCFADLLNPNVVDSNTTEVCESATSVPGRGDDTPIRFQVLARAEPWPHWGIWRDGEPCESALAEGYVLFQLQRELNRVALERSAVWLNAACVEINGRAAILAGAGGSGKTTLAGSMSVKGAGYVADEIVAIDEAGCAVPFQRPLGVRLGGPLQPLIHDQAVTESRFAAYEQLVAVSSIGGHLCLEPPPVGVIVVPQFIPGAATAITSLSSAEALAALCAGAPGLGVHGRSVFAALTRLASRVPAMSLVSTDLAVAGRLVRQALIGAQDVGGRHG